MRDDQTDATTTAQLAALAAEPLEQCHKDSPRLVAAELREPVERLSGWRLIEVDGVLRLNKVYKFAQYPKTLAFANRVAEIAEAGDHHPRLVIEWGTVEVSWWTHVIRGIHRNDLRMAAQTESIRSSLSLDP